MSATPSLNGNWLPIFRAGDYGKKGKYTVRELQQLAAEYASADQAALTIGHPQSDNEPAFGWLKELRMSGDTLEARPGDVPTLIDSLHQAGSYKHRSVGVSRGPHGKLRLRHVALLGAVPPAVQGLGPAHFSSDPYQEFAIGEGDSVTDDQKLKKTMGDIFRDFFSEKKGEVQPLDEQALEDRLTAKFSAQIEEERSARRLAEGKVATLEQQFSAGTAQGRAAAAIAELKSSGCWVPAYEKLGVPELFASLAGSAEQITFSDANKAEQKQDPLAVFSGVLKAVGRIVPSGQIAAGAQSAAGAGSIEANGASVDSASATFSDQVRRHADEKGISYAEARAALQSRRPAPGASSAGGI